MACRHTVSLNGILKTSTALAGMVAAFAAAPAMALPQGGVVTHGQATIASSGAVMNIHQGSDKAIINWQQFDIGANEATHFHQPSANAVALNRVTGSQDPSKILGTLTANGKVMLVNPNGVVFGKDAKVDVAGLVASTADITDQDFLNGKLAFTLPGDADAKIINHGSISAREGGLVALVAPGVENHGVIRANQGTVAIAGGEKATLDFYGDELIQFTVDGKSAGIVNTGAIAANDGGAVYLTAKAASSVVDHVINTSGVIEASSARVEGGVIVLDGGEGSVAIAGTVDAGSSAAKGGEVRISGKNIALAAATVNASGKSEGGNIAIGGAKRGQSDANADTVSIDRASKLSADAVQGTGGEIVIWSEKATDYKGALSATGGTTGGFAEVSSRGQLGFDGAVDLSGAQGKGTLLLDPDKAVIGSATTNDAEIADGTVNAADGSGTFFISADAVEAALAVASVIIEAIDLIEVKSAIESLSGNDLTLKADNVTVNADITITGNLDIIALAGDALINKLVEAFTVDVKAGNRAIVGTNGTVRGLRNATGNVNAVTVKAKDVFVNGTVEGNADVIVDASNLARVRGEVVSHFEDVEIEGKNVFVEGTVTSGPDSPEDDIRISADSQIRIEETAVLTSGDDVRLRDAERIYVLGTINAFDEITLIADNHIFLGGNFASGDVLTEDNLAAHPDADGVPLSGRVSSSKEVTVLNDNNSIQLAVDIVQADGRVNVQPGTYDEYVFIDKNLELRGINGDSSSIIIRPTTLTNDYADQIIEHSFDGNKTLPIITIKQANVFVRNLTVDGADVQTGFAGDERAGGIGFSQAGGRVQGVHVTNIADDGIGASGNTNIITEGFGGGVGIFADNGTDHGDSGEGGDYEYEYEYEYSYFKQVSVGGGYRLDIVDTLIDNTQDIGVHVRDVTETVLTDTTVEGGNTGLLIDGPASFMTFGDLAGGSSFNGQSAYTIALVNDAMDDLDLAVNTVYLNGVRGDAHTTATGEPIVWDETDDNTVGDIVFPRGEDTTPGDTTPGGPGGPGDPTPPVDEPETPIDTTPGGEDTTAGGDDDTLFSLNEIDIERESEFFDGLFSFFGKTLAINNNLDGSVDIDLNLSGQNGTTQNLNNLSPEQLGEIEPAAGPGAAGGEGEACVQDYLAEGYQQGFSLQSCSKTQESI